MAERVHTPEELVDAFLPSFEEAMNKYRLVEGGMHWTIRSALHERTVLSLIPAAEKLLKQFGYQGEYPLDIAAAKTIYADGFIKRFKDGYDHKLEERGTGLSAGEKQLLSFARIILKNPSVVILDEATSSIDTETEALIQKALAKILKDKTSFMVAHRLSTIRSADRILYISNKGIAEQGSHEELMAMKGLYYALN